MQYIKFVSYKKNGNINVKLSHEYNADIIPSPQRHSMIIEKIMAKGYSSKDLISYGVCEIQGNRLEVLSNDYFYTYTPKCDDKIKNEINLKWSLHKIQLDMVQLQMWEQMRWS